MKFRFTKKGIIALSLLAVLLAGAIWLNIRVNSGKEDKKDDAQSSAAPQDALQTDDSSAAGTDVFNDYFASFRNERNDIRAQEIEYLRMIIADETTDKAALLDAQNRLLELVNNMEKEFAIENLIRGKGFKDAAVTVRSGSVNVIIDGKTLTDEEVARILDVVCGETGASAKQVKISLSNG